MDRRGNPALRVRNFWMPIAYRLIRDPPLILSSYSGVVTEEDYLHAYRAIFASSDYRPDMHELADTRAMVTFDVQLPAIRTLAALAASTVDQSDSSMQTAVIQGSAMNLGVSKLYAAVADLHQKESLRLFPTLAEAAAWLSLPPSAIPMIDKELTQMSEA